MVWCSQRAIPRDLGVAGGVWCAMDVNIQNGVKNITKGVRKNENEPAQIHETTSFQANTSKHETSKKQQNERSKMVHQIELNKICVS